MERVRSKRPLLRRRAASERGLGTPTNDDGRGPTALPALSFRQTFARIVHKVDCGAVR